MQRTDIKVGMQGMTSSEVGERYLKVDAEKMSEALWHVGHEGGQYVYVDNDGGR